MIKLYLTLIYLFFNLSSAWGQYCGYYFTSSNFVAEIGTSEQSVAHPLRLWSFSNSNNCRNARMYFSRGNANNYSRKAFSGSKTVAYNLYKETALNNILKDFGDAGTNEYIDFRINRRFTFYDIDFFVKVVDLDSVFSNGPGYYNDLIEVKLYSVRANGQEVYQTSTYINIQIIIPRYAELSLGPMGSPHDPSSTQHIMSFGNLSTGKTAQAALNVKSTVSFGVYMSSLNGSVLKKGASEIPYTINVNQAGHRSLTNPGQSYYITQRNISTPVNYEVFPIEARIGTMPSNPDTGEYSDVITVTVTPW
ncbi:MAG: hypothetical protein CME63_05905 [Halobacteriovoraceae bacterium]|nr:hypothetical protein [Halobacteriovoraceae bacterium]|tara:strand:+ start:17525 stop:18445 length:921 start_codon:yes stop_codon:yes gene_type:complete